MLAGTEMILRTNRESRLQGDSNAFINASKLLVLLVLYCFALQSFASTSVQDWAAFPGISVFAKSSCDCEDRITSPRSDRLCLPRPCPPSPFVAPRSVRASSSRVGGVPAGHLGGGEAKRWDGYLSGTIEKQMLHVRVQDDTGFGIGRRNIVDVLKQRRHKAFRCWRW